VRQWLSENHPGREAPVPWPLRLPDLNSLSRKEEL
jgi:hypothetical protein